MHMNVKSTTLIANILLFLSTSFVTNITQAEEALVFSAPPGKSAQSGKTTYGPIARYLSKVTGKKVIYQHPRNWQVYTNNMRHNKYDFVFDGPHFVSWRIKHLNHRPAVKIPGDIVFAFVSKKSNGKIKQINDLIARKVCGQAPPNQSALLLYSLLDNPMRQPTLIAVDGSREIYNAMMEGKCEAAILPMSTYKKLDPNKINTKVIFRSRPAPGHAITVSPNLSDRDFKRIRSALLASEGQHALKNLQSRFGSSSMIPASSSEYRSEHSLLQSSYGFDIY